MTAQPPLRTYGRIKARPLKAVRARLIDTLLPALRIDLADPLSLAGARQLPFTAGHVLPREGEVVAQRPEGAPAKVVLEIGFGGGEHLVAQAAAAPETLHLGAEPFLNGVGACLKLVNAAGLNNIRLYPDDVRDLIGALPPACLSRVDILFPDPWQKARHHKRRLVQTPFLETLAAHMKPGAEVRFATDWADYALTAEAAFRAAPSYLAVQAPGPNAWPGHVQTRYELKRLGDCPPVFMRFARR
jgi:tRNA (guanine-N7-)-methyltransferase